MNDTMEQAALLTRQVVATLAAFTPAQVAKTLRGDPQRRVVTARNSY